MTADNHDTPLDPEQLQAALAAVQQLMDHADQLGVDTTLTTGHRNGMPPPPLPQTTTDLLDLGTSTTSDRAGTIEDLSPHGW